uniref:Transcription initiation factor TFIID subunit 13 n=2 Tax=Ursidae TaxID=9632 RepID=A0A7N5JWF9_AILME
MAGELPGNRNWAFQTIGTRDPLRALCAAARASHPSHQRLTPHFTMPFTRDPFQHPTLDNDDTYLGKLRASKFEEENEEIGGGAEGGQGKRKRLFSKELRCMMYGFGDDQNPYTESVDILEDLVIEFITEMTHKAMSIGRQGRVQVEDIVFLIRKDPRKFARVKDLLTMNEELKRARKAFDEANYGS